VCKGEDKMEQPVFSSGGAAGPDLYNVIDRQVAHNMDPAHT